MRTVPDTRRPAKSLVYALALGMLACMLALSACTATQPPVASSSSSVEPAGDGPYGLLTDGTLTVATFADNAPMEYMEGGNITGFDVALISEIANRLGLSVSIHDEYFDALLAQVANGESYDCAISSISMNAQREQGVLFTAPYLDSSLAIVVPETSTATSVEELAALAVGAQRATPAEEWVGQNLPGAPYTPFQTTSDLLGALGSGAIGVAVCDWPTVSHAMKNAKAGYRVLAIVPTGEQYGIAVNAGNPGLADAINGVLAEMEADGTMAKLKAEWFGEKAQ